MSRGGAQGSPLWELRVEGFPGLRRLSEYEFESFPHVDRPPPYYLIAEPREWYAHEQEHLLGVLVRDKIDDDWSYAVLGKDHRSTFRYIDGETSISTQGEARSQLLRRMEELGSAQDAQVS